MNRFVLGALVGLAAALIVLRLSRRRAVPEEPKETTAPAPEEPVSS